jgi:hypothetical protein
MLGIIVSYIIGTLIGVHFGNVLFKKYHIQETIDVLIQEKFLRFVRRPDGEIEILKYSDSPDS